MSAAASRLELGKPSDNEPVAARSKKDPIENERAVLENLTGITPDLSISTIAVDLDDVLSQTNQAVADCTLPSYLNATTPTRSTRA
jgi:hypothetical protein